MGRDALQEEYEVAKSVGVTGYVAYIKCWSGEVTVLWEAAVLVLRKGTCIAGGYSPRISNWGVSRRRAWCWCVRDTVPRSGSPLRGRGGCTCLRRTFEWGLTEVGKFGRGVSRSGPPTPQPRRATGWDLKGVQLVPRGEPGSVRGSPEHLVLVTRGETVTATK